VADDLKALDDHLVAELDDLASVNEVADYPSSGNKAEKIAALEAAGVGPQPTQVFKLQLRPEFFTEKNPVSQSADAEGEEVEATASFMANGKAITLEGDEVYTTHDRRLAAGLAELPFLQEVQG